MGSGTFARRAEKALAPLLFFLFVILPLYHKSLSPRLSYWLLHFSQKNHSICISRFLSQLIPISVFLVCAFLFVLLLSVIETKLNLGSVFSFFQCPDQALARLPKFNLTMTQPNFTHGLNKIDKPVTRYLSVSPTVCLLSLLLSVVSFPQQTVVKCSPVANITTPQPGSLILISSSLSLSYTQTYIHICTFFAPHTPRAPFALWGL